MSTYYYLRATLPTLLESAAAPFPFEGFLARCEPLMKKADLEVLRTSSSLAADNPQSEKAARRSSILTAFRTWERSLRNELARIRAQKLGKQSDRYLRPGSPEWDALQVAQGAAQMENPLEGEIFIEREKWRFVDSLETGHHFDLEELAAYALKLQILQRRALFEAERGEGSYKTAYREILETAETSPAE